MIMSDSLSEVAVITLDNAPVNSLSHTLRERIAQQLDAALADRAIRAIVLAGNDKAFSAGADVAEFGTPRQSQEPILRSVIARIEESAIIRTRHCVAHAQVAGCSSRSARAVRRHPGSVM